MDVRTVPLPSSLPATASGWQPLTVDVYEGMIDAGLIGEKARIYLWNGLLVAKMPKNRPHSVVTGRLADALAPLAAGRCYVELEQALRLRFNDLTRPEPDLKLVRGGWGDYASVPTTADVPLVIEVADSTLGDDRNFSASMYAAEEIPYYWIANIRRRRIEVYAEPTGPTASPRYQAPVAIFERGQAVPVVIDGAVVGEVAVSDVFRETDAWMREGEE